VFGAAAEAWVKKDSNSLLNFARSFPDGQPKTEFFYQVTDAFLSNGLLFQAAALLEVMPLSNLRVAAMERLAMIWSSQDAIAAINWASTLTSPEDRNSSQNAIMRALAGRKDTENLRALYQTSSASLRAQIAVKLGQLGVKDLGLPNSGDGATVRDSELLFIGSIESRAASELRSVGRQVREISTPGIRVKAFDAYIARLLVDSPNTAIEWVLSLPPDGQTTGAAVLAARWYAIDTEGLNKWVRSLESGPVKDSALHTWAQQLKASDPEGAARAIAEISDPRMKAAALRSLNGR
jgi:hypothetical protein